MTQGATIAMSDLGAVGTPITRDNPAIELEDDGSTRRTIWGYYKNEDADVIGARYPKVGREITAKIASLIHDPRMLEVLGVVEVLQRFLEGTFSKITKGSPEGVNLVANPLSILFWNEREGRVQRIVTPETEGLHKPMEKLSLRVGSLLGINELLEEQFGAKLAFGCSCCVIMTGADEMPAMLGSEYYWKREQLGRRYDSDVLAACGDLFSVGSVADVPQWVKDATVDFHEEEVASYRRLWAVAHEALAASPMDVDVNSLDQRAACFLGGHCACPIN